MQCLSCKVLKKCLALFKAINKGFLPSAPLAITPQFTTFSLPWRETVLDRQVVSGGLLLWLKLMDAATDGQPKLSKSDSLWSLQSCMMTRRNGSLETDARQWQHSGGEVLCCRGFHQPWLFLPSSIWRAAFASFL